MQNKISSKKNTKELNISITAYRALLALSLLLEKPLTREEITKAFKDNPITAKSFSLDTIRVTLNTLKAVGCMISRPTSKNNYRYVMFSHPFGFELTEEHIKCLSLIRLNLIHLGDWQLILSTNDLYKKIASITRNINCIEMINNTEPMLDIDKKLLKSLTKYASNKNKIIIEYLSPENGIEDLEIIIDKINYESDKLYILCYSYKYNNYSYLRVDKIKSVKNVSKESHIIKKENYKATYMVKGDSISTFQPVAGEKILEKNQNYILIEAEVTNEFKFTQRLLLFGQDFNLKSPDSLKEKLIRNLQALKQGYSL